MPSDAFQEQPQVRVVQSGAPRRLGEGFWQVTFDVANNGGGPVSLLAAWLPHGKFRCQETPLDGTPPVPAGGEALLTFPVLFDEEPGVSVENTFVILRLLWRGGTWRVLTRFTVTAGVDGSPQAAPELVSAHPVGFSR